MVSDTQSIEARRNLSYTPNASQCWFLSGLNILSCVAVHHPPLHTPRACGIGGSPDPRGPSSRTSRPPLPGRPASLCPRRSLPQTLFPFLLPLALALTLPGPCPRGRWPSHGLPAAGRGPAASPTAPSQNRALTKLTEQRGATVQGDQEGGWVQPCSLFLYGIPLRNKWVCPEESGKQWARHAAPRGPLMIGIAEARALGIDSSSGPTVSPDSLPPKSPPSASLDLSPSPSPPLLMLSTVAHDS